MSGGNPGLVATLGTLVILSTPSFLGDGEIDHSDRLEQIAKDQHANDTNQFNAFGI